MDHSRAAACQPLADFPAEVELHSRPNLCRYDGQDLLSGYALLGSLNDRMTSTSAVLGIATLGTPEANPDCDCAKDSPGSITRRKGTMNFIG
jgi:hypothetical protein